MDNGFSGKNETLLVLHPNTLTYIFLVVGGGISKYELLLLWFLQRYVVKPVWPTYYTCHYAQHVTV